MSGERKVGENFDADKAGSIFDKLKNVEGKIKPKGEGKFDNIKNMMNEAQYIANCKNNEEFKKRLNEL